MLYCDGMPTLVLRAAKLAYENCNDELLTAEDAFIAGYAAAVAARNKELNQDNLPEIELPSFVTKDKRRKQENKPKDLRVNTTTLVGNDTWKFNKTHTDYDKVLEEGIRISTAALCSLVSKRSPYAKSEVSDVMSLVLEELLDQVISGRQVFLDKFGSFKLRVNHPRAIKNPIFGNFISKGSVTLKFVPNKELGKWLRRHSPSIVDNLNATWNQEEE